MRRLGTVFLLLLSAIPAAWGRDPASGHGGAVSTTDRYATEVGIEILQQGGNAIDAAVATAFALAVTHPMAGNIGGGGLMLARSGSGLITAYDFREVAPSGAFPEMFLRDGRYDPERHHQSLIAVGIPGTVAGLYQAWKKQGTIAWARLLAPAIKLAKRGFPVSVWLAHDLAANLETFRADPAAAAVFIVRGKTPAAGSILVQHDLARTLERIAKLGPEDFYRGKTAAMLLSTLRAGGSTFRAEDLAGYLPIERAPLVGSYRGWRLTVFPPSSSGGIATLETLNQLEQDEPDSGGFGSARAIHRLVEALRHSYLDRARYLGDPAFNPAMPIDRLISKPYALALWQKRDEQRAERSDPAQATPLSEEANTTHLSVIDTEGNTVALTYTLEDAYGVKRMVPGAGFLLNNEMGDFNAVPGLTDLTGLIGTAPNLAAPGKRMLSSMAPTIAERDGTIVALGSAGGRRIISTVVQGLLNMIDYGMNPQEAIDAPRVHHQWLPDQIFVETRGFSPDTLELLRARGHTIKLGWPYPSRMQIVKRNSDGSFEAGCDARFPDCVAAAVKP